MSIAGRASGSIAVKEILKRMPAKGFRPGDMVATNNPWWIMGHLNDIAVVAPLFHRGRLVGFAECMAHMADIGGSLSGAPRDVYEEGIIIPPLKIFDRVVVALAENVRKALKLVPVASIDDVFRLAVETSTPKAAAAQKRASLRPSAN